jgi:glycosyltransferase involved in cell wall biosynthesis
MPAAKQSLLIVADSLDGGIGAAVLSHCRVFADKGWCVTLAAPTATLHPVDGVTPVDLVVPDAAAQLRLMSRAARHARDLVRVGKPDVVHAHGLRSLAVLLGAGQRPFVTLHSSDRAPGRVSPWVWAKERFRDLTPALVPGAFSVVPLSRGRWTAVLLPSPRLPALDALVDEPVADAPLFVFVSRLAWPKRPEVFVEAMAELARHAPEARGVVLGDGPDRQALERRIEATGAPVRLMGQVDDMTSWYRQAWGVCLFSHSEGLPFVVQEAMWAGRPVITSDLPGILWFAGEAAFYTRDAAATARVLLELCDPAARLERGKAARTRARSMFGDDRVYRTLAAAYGFEGGQPAPADSE